MYRTVLGQLELTEKHLLLDAGCGAGLFSKLAIKTGAEVIGVDAASGLLEVAKQRNPQNNFLEEDLEALPFTDNCFHVVTGFNSFQYAGNFEKALIEFSPDIILSDHSLPSFNSIMALKTMKDAKINAPFILITSTVSEEFAVEMMKAGAYDYILKDRLQRLPQSVLKAMEKFQLEADRQEFLEGLMQRNKNLEQFAYIISHNLRAPVASILGLVDLFQNESLSDTEKEEVMKFLFSSVKRLDGVIKDLNHILQVKKDVSEKREEIRLTELVDDIRLSIGNLVQSEQAIIVCDFSGAETIVSVKSYLHSIFYNLISNSIKYRRPNEAPVIEIKSNRRRDGKIELSFQDNGIGIDLEKDGQEIFGLYKRFHTQVEGKGMGLFMVKIQVETLRGKINIKSKVNEGTRFKIEFPEE